MQDNTIGIKANKINEGVTKNWKPYSDPVDETASKHMEPRQAKRHSHDLQ